MKPATNSTVAFWGCICCSFASDEPWTSAVFVVLALLNLSVELFIKAERHR
jgi:hypothetical protein